MKPLATESAYEDTLIAAARLLGYRAHAERPARTLRGHRTAIKGDAGWPDLCICGYDRVLFLELKRPGNKPTAEQVAWLAALNAAGCDARLVYVPDDLDDLIAELRRHRSQHLHPSRTL